MLPYFPFGIGWYFPCLSTGCIHIQREKIEAKIFDYHLKRGGAPPPPPGPAPLVRARAPFPLRA